MQKSILMFLFISLASCSQLPTGGPYSGDIEKSSQLRISDADIQWVDTEQNTQYLVVDIKPRVTAHLLQRASTPRQIEWPINETKMPVTINVGDTLQITIFEAQSGGLFIPKEAGVRAGNFVSIPSQLVDYTGKITVPFAGEITVLNRTPAAVGEEITQKLIKRAIEPQVVVSLVGRSNSAVTILGDVKQNSRLALNLDGDRILDTVARAGGLSYPDFQTYLALRRAGKEWVIRFDDLMRAPNKNIYLRSQDTLYLYRDPDRYQVYGAAGINSSFDFTNRQMSLSDALGKAGGLDQSLADPEEIYLFRYESSQSLKPIIANTTLQSQISNSERLPVIYKLNLREAEGFFLARNFPLQNRDIIYLANAESVEFLRFLNLLDASAVTTINVKEAGDIRD
jgi:polysaccharide biosynthesis/export protein